MKGTWFLLVLILICSACAEEVEKAEGKKVVNEWQLPLGEFYAQTYRHSDTIILQALTESSMISGWTELYWSISEDSLIQTDARGHTYMMGRTNGTWQTSRDTLLVTFARKDNVLSTHRIFQKNEGKLFEDKIQKYLILQANDSLIEIARVRDTLSSRVDTDIRGDIQLR